MAAQTREYLRSRFETNDQPSAQDFIDLIDSFLLITAQFWFDATDTTMWIDEDGEPWAE